MPYPEEARKKGIQGKVTLSIVVDSKGNVSQSKALSGPPELFQAAIDSTKLWQFEPPAFAPVVKTVEVSYGFPKECPGSISDSGEVSAGGWMKTKKGNVISVSDDKDEPLPPYFEDERRGGVGGTMILSVTIDVEGKVTKIHIAKSLSTHLDAEAVKTVSKWKFRLERIA